MTLRKWDTGNWNRNHQVALSADLALEEDMDRPYDRLRDDDDDDDYDHDISSPFLYFSLQMFQINAVIFIQKITSNLTEY